LDSFDIDQDVFIVDLDFATLVRLAALSETYYEELNRFPSVERDLAVVINKDVPFSQVKEVVLKTGGKWLTDLEVFDVYANADHLGENKKSVALRFTIENKEATLTDKDIDQWFVSVQKALTKEVGAEIRR
jgi:phenylalanyl-tRNA synthetase beta chain